jgi:hypothetical protein
MSNAMPAADSGDFERSPADCFHTHVVTYLLTINLFG